jgi:hypothetical protein
MKLSELILHVGDENLGIQNLDAALLRAQVRKRDGEITFATERTHVLQRGLDQPVTHIAFVVWLPVDRLPENLKPKTP